MLLIHTKDCILYEVPDQALWNCLCCVWHAGVSQSSLHVTEISRETQPRMTRLFAVVFADPNLRHVGP